MRKLRVLDLYAGLEGWSEPFRDRGHTVLSLDIDPDFKCDISADVLHWNPRTLPWRPDIILASPPCETFSMLAMARNWHRDGSPKTEKAALALRIVERTVEIVNVLRPRFFLIENPRARLRTLDSNLRGLERRTVTYCQFGEPFMKPTDLWGKFPPSLNLPPPCAPRRSCHIAAPRGSRTGIQGEGVRVRGLQNWSEGHQRVFGTTSKTTLAALRAKIPYKLSLAVCLAAEHDLNKSRP